VPRTATSSSLHSVSVLDLLFRRPKLGQILNDNKALIENFKQDCDNGLFIKPLFFVCFLKKVN